MKVIVRNGETGKYQEQPAATAGGSANAGNIPQLDDQGRLTADMMPSGIGADTWVLEASEALSAGDIVNVYDDFGTMKVRKADAATAKQADGYVKAAYGSGAMATVFFDGQIEQLTGLTAGLRYYLSETAGGVVSTPVSGAGKLHQYIGKALSATVLTYDADDGLILA